MLFAINRIRSPQCWDNKVTTQWPQTRKTVWKSKTSLWNQFSNSFPAAWMAGWLAGWLPGKVSLSGGLHSLTLTGSFWLRAWAHSPNADWCADSLQIRADLQPVGPPSWHSPTDPHFCCSRPADTHGLRDIPNQRQPAAWGNDDGLWYGPLLPSSGQIRESTVRIVNSKYLIPF